MLSGGQRQRVALARALYKDGDLVLLDDVLSAVDHETEAALVGDPGGLGLSDRRPTVVIVSHRVSALRHCDRVVVLEGGRVVDQGSPAELLRRPGLFLETALAQRPQGGAP
jgi:ABC-type multidrug transport system fused ATPase/permease subunit